MLPFFQEFTRPITQVERFLLHTNSVAGEHLRSLITGDTIRQIQIDPARIPPYPEMENLQEYIPRETILKILFYCADCSRTFPGAAPRKDALKKLAEILGQSNIRTERMPYELAPRAHKRQMGRYYAKGGVTLGSLPGVIRKTIFRAHNYVDFDLKKCNPSILMFIGKLNGYDMDGLSRYISSPDEVIQELVDHWSSDEHTRLTAKDIKRLINGTLYGEGLQGWFQEMTVGKTADGEIVPIRTIRNQHLVPPAYSMIRGNCEFVRDTIYTNHPHLVDLFEGTEHERKMSMVSYVVTTIEHYITYNIMAELIAMGFVRRSAGRFDVSWGYDGFTFVPSNTAPDVATMLEVANDCICGQCPSVADVLMMAEKKVMDDEVIMTVLEEDHPLWLSNEFSLYEGEEYMPPVAKLKDVIASSAQLTWPEWKEVYENNWAGRKHARVYQNGSMHYAEIIHDKRGNIDNVIFRTHAELLQAQSNFRYKPSDGKDPGKGPATWSTCPNPKYFYERADVYPPPLVCPAECLNMWKESPFFGMPVRGTTARRQEAVERFFDLGRAVCGDSGDGSWEWIVHWFADALRNPGIKPGIVPVFTGSEGTGKSLLAQVMVALVGLERALITKASSIFGSSFNDLLSGRLLVVVDEIPKEWNQQAAAEFKIAVTDPRITINKKNVSPSSEQSFHRFICTTNETEPSVPSTRRPFYVKSSLRVKKMVRNANENEIMNRFGPLLNDPFTQAAVYKFLMTEYRVDQTHLPPPPYTEFNKEMRGTNPLMRFLREVVCNLPANIPVLPGIHETTYTELLDVYKSWCKDHGIPDKFTAEFSALQFYGTIRGFSWPTGTFLTDEISKRLRIHLQHVKDNVTWI